MPAGSYNPLKWGEKVISFDCNHDYDVLCYISSQTYGMFIAYGSFFLPNRLQENPCEKSAIQGINRLLPY